MSKNYPLVEKINIYTDCQNTWKYKDKYMENVNLIKIKGHQQMNKMNEQELIFKQVDKEVRKKLRTF